MPADARQLAHEARVVGLRQVTTPSLEAVERRRWQLWTVAFVVMASLAAGLVALLMLDRGDIVGSVVAAVMVGVSLGSSGIGLPITIGVVAEVLLRRASRRELLVLVIPIALYILWWIGYQQAGFGD